MPQAPDPNNLMDSPVAGLVDPVEYAKIMRRNQLAQILQQDAMTPESVQNPHPVGSSYVQPRIGALQSLAKLATGVVAGHLAQRSRQDQAQVLAQIMQKVNYGNPQGGNGGGDGGPAAAAPNPLNPLHAPAGPLTHLLLTDPKAYLEQIRGTTEYQNALAANNGDQRAAQQSMLAKASAELEKTKNEALKSQFGETRVNQALINYKDPTKPIFMGPDPANGMQYHIDPGSGDISAREIPGADPLVAKRTAMVEAEKEHQHPVSQTDEQGRERYGFVSPPGLRLGGAPPAGAGVAPGAPAPQGGPGKRSFGAPPGLGGGGGGMVKNAQTTAGKESQSTGAASGQKYSAMLAADAQGGLDVHRTLAEMTNLSKSTDPSVQNTLKGQVAAMMLGMGMKEDDVGAFLHIDPGSLTAAQKLNSHLAQVSTKMVTSRGTNFDLDTFMKNNPNLAMTPGGFKRVIEFMDKQAIDTMDKQKDFLQFRKNITPDEWEAEHTSHWNDIVRQRVKSGATNSRPPLSSFEKP